jgi:hypothetical protein
MVQVHLNEVKEAEKTFVIRVGPIENRMKLDSTTEASFPPFRDSLVYHSPFAPVQFDVNHAPAVARNSLRKL